MVPHRTPLGRVCWSPSKLSLDRYLVDYANHLGLGKVAASVIAPRENAHVSTQNSELGLGSWWLHGTTIIL